MKIDVLQKDVADLLKQEVDHRYEGVARYEIPKSVLILANNIDKKYKPEIFQNYWNGFVKMEERGIEYKEIQKSMSQEMVNTYLKEKYLV